MAAVLPTLLDLLRSLDPNGVPAAIIELLNKKHPLVMDMPMVATNKETTHQTTVETGLPTITWGAINQGVDASFGTTAQMTFPTGYVEAMTQVHSNLMELASGADASVAREHMRKQEGMAQELSTNIYYGGMSALKFPGYAKYYSVISTDPQNAGYNILDAGGTVAASNYSIWCIGWGPMSTHGIYPKNTEGGFMIKQEGERNTLDINNKTLRVFQTYYKWASGICIPDWRGVCRIANIDKTAMYDSSTVDLVQLMGLAKRRVKRAAGPQNIMFYMAEEVLTALETQLRKAGNAAFGYKELEGITMMTFRDSPLRTDDALILENQVT